MKIFKSFILLFMITTLSYSGDNVYSKAYSLTGKDVLVRYIDEFFKENNLKKNANVTADKYLKIQKEKGNDISIYSEPILLDSFIEKVILPDFEFLDKNSTMVKLKEYYAKEQKRIINIALKLGAFEKDGTQFERYFKSIYITEKREFKYPVDKDLIEKYVIVPSFVYGNANRTLTNKNIWLHPKEFRGYISYNPKLIYDLYDLNKRVETDINNMKRETIEKSKRSTFSKYLGDFNIFAGDIYEENILINYIKMPLIFLRDLTHHITHELNIMVSPDKPLNPYLVVSFSYFMIFFILVIFREGIVSFLNLFEKR